MPELAEVAWFARQWEPGRGSRVTAVHCRDVARVFRTTDAAALRRGLIGRRLTRIRTHGKQMLFTFEDASLGVHLGMTGELLVAPQAHIPGKHDHLVLQQKGRSLVFRDPRMFGAVRFEPGPEEPAWWSALPPEVLSPAFTTRLVESAARRRRASPLKAFLLDQTIFPGVGNWMADEILWRCRLHPADRVGSLENNVIIILRKEARHVSRAALRLLATGWSDPPPTWLFLHRWKDGGLCPRDGAALRREDIGGRTTAWCPECQKPRRRATG